MCCKSTKLIKIDGNIIDLSTPKVMGIINCTPDSFYEKSRVNNIDLVLKKVENQLIEGANFIDIGAYSSRPDAKNISEKEEIERLIPFIKAINKNFKKAIISVDTFRANVAKEAIENGAKIINDISAFNLDENMLKVLEKYKTTYIMMHMKGTPQTMKNEMNYGNLMNEIIYYFSEKISILKQIGINDIIIDPGFGFAKTIDQNYEILEKLNNIKKIIELPILVGLSRKSMIYKKLNISPDEALNGTTVLNTIAIQKGANILRVHDVKEAVELIKLQNH
jgi:dihydropteroate synthase